MFWVVFEVTVGSSNFPRRFHPKVSKGLSGFNVVAEPRAPEACAMSGRRERSPRGRSRSNGSGLSSISSARMNQRPLTAAEAAAEAVAEAQRARSQSRARQRARSVPADTSPTYHRPAGVDRRPLPSEGRTNGQLPQLPGMSNAPGQASTQNPVVAQGNGAGGLSESLVRQMLQAQDDQLRAQAVQLQQMGAMLQDAIKLATTTAQQVQQSAASSAAPVAGTADSSGDVAASSSDPVPMDVDSGIRSRRAENYIPQLPQLNFAGMSSRHAEIRIWTAYREELTAWLCLLDDRYAEELREAATSAVEVSQVALSVGKAARSTKLWFLLRQSLSKFQRAQDFVQLIGVNQKGASAGYELWRMLNNELSVRSRVEGQALREQVLSLRAPKHISRALDMMRWYTTELLKYDSQIKPRFPELAVTEQEAILAVLRHLDEEAKRYLLLHGTTSSLEALMRGLQFYDEQLRVLTFQKEHQPGKFLNAFADQGKGKDGKGKDGKGKDGKGKDGKGKKGDPKGGQKGAGKRQKTPKGKGKGKQGGRGRSKSRDKSKDTCNYCHQKGHWAPECPQKKADQQAKASSAAESFGKEPEAESAPSQASNATSKASSAAKGNGKTGAKTGTKSAVLMSLIPGANAMAVSDLKFHAQFLPLKFFFESMSMHDMVFLLCMAVVLCCVGWLVWRLQGFLRHMYNHPAREIRVAWHNIARARAAFRSSSGVASDFDNWVLLDSGASVTIISEAFLNKCCTVISRGKSDSPVSISTATSESLRVDEEVSCILHCHQPGGEIVGVHLKGYVSEKVPLTLVSTGILGTGGWKIGNKGPLMTLNYSGTRLATHLYANCSWVYAIDSREDYAIETMKDLGISIPPNLGSSLVPVPSSPRPGAQITEASVRTAKPVSNATKATKPALKPEAGQAQATVSQCQCECEGCLIGNCPKEIKKLGLIPEVSPGCICKAVIYQTCFVPSTCAVKFHECFCNSLSMFQDGMCTCHDMFLCNLGRALSNLMLCLTCLACWLSRVVLVVLLEILEAWLGRVMFELSKVVESLVRLNARHLMLKLAFKRPKKRIVKKKPAASVPVKEKKVKKKAAVKARPKYKRGKRPFVPEVDSVCVPMQEMPTPEELHLLGLEKEAHESGYRTARDRMEMAMQQLEQATPSAVKAQATAKATAKATAAATAPATAKATAQATAQATATATAPATAPATAWRTKPYSWPPARSLRSSTQVGVPLRELYQNLPSSSTAYAQSELGREAPKTPPKGPATVPTKAKSEVDQMETWGKWQPLSPAKALPPPPPVPPAAPTAVSLEQRERPVARPVTLADLKRLEPYPALLALAQEALLRGPWILNVGQQISLGLLEGSLLDRTRSSPLTATSSSSRTPPTPPPVPTGDLLDLPVPPPVPTGDLLDLPTPPPVPVIPPPPKVPVSVPMAPPVHAEGSVRPKLPQAKEPPVKSRPKEVAVKAMPVETVHSDSDRD